MWQPTIISSSTEWIDFSTRHAPFIKLPEGATEEDHLGLLGVLNSSTACFWLKQNSHDKGRGWSRGWRRRAWEHRFEFTGTTLQDFPLPAELPARACAIARPGCSRRIHAVRVVDGSR